MTTEALEKLRALRLDPQTRNMGMSGWICTLEVHGKIETAHSGNEADAVANAWKWLQANPIEADDWGGELAFAANCRCANCDYLPSRHCHYIRSGGGRLA